jgi:threonine synthase
MGHRVRVRPAFLECTQCGKRHVVKLANLCDCGAPLFARYDLSAIRRENLLARRDLWRYAPLLPLSEGEIQSRGEGGTPLHHLTRIGSGSRPGDQKVAALHVKDEGLNPTGTFKARGMAVAVPMARALGARSVLAPTAGNAGAALALYAAAHGLEATVLVTPDAPAEARQVALACGARVLQVDGDITDAGRLAHEVAASTGAFNLATLREPYRVEGKKTLLLEIWEDLGGMPDWILFPTGGGTGVAGIWKALGELRDLGWYEGPWPRIGLVQAEGCAPLVRAWKAARESAEAWAHPRTAAAGLRVPATLADRIVLRAIRETRGACVAVTEEDMRLAVGELAAHEGISACLEGAATLAGFRRLHDEGVIRPEDRVVLVNTGRGRNSDEPRPPDIPVVRTADQVIAELGLTSRAS